MYQGDHGFFLLNQRPALAMTSELVTELMTEIIHTPKDRWILPGLPLLLLRSGIFCCIWITFWCKQILHGSTGFLI